MAEFTCHLLVVWIRVMGHESRVWEKMKWPEMRMVRWMCDVSLKERQPSTGLRRRIGVVEAIEDVMRTWVDWMLTLEGYMVAYGELSSVSKPPYNEADYPSLTVTCPHRVKLISCTFFDISPTCPSAITSLYSYGFYFLRYLSRQSSHLSCDLTLSLSELSLSMFRRLFLPFSPSHPALYCFASVQMSSDIIQF